MKRNIELIRKLMLYAEEHDQMPLDGVSIIPNSEENWVPNFDEDRMEVYRHIKLLDEAGFIVGINTSCMRFHGYKFKDITWEGHDFIDSIRSNEIWDSVKSKVSKVGGWTIGVLAEVAKDEIKRKLGLG